MANQEIYCTVNPCYYWGNGDKCMAEKIMVKNNSAGMRNANMEVGTIGGEASHSIMTLCDTFIPKEKGPKSGINRLEGR